MDYNRVVKDLNGFTVDELLKKLEAKGIKANSTGPHRIRFVTHLDVHPEQVEWVVNGLKAI